MYNIYICVCVCVHAHEWCDMYVYRETVQPIYDTASNWPHTFYSHNIITTFKSYIHFTDMNVVRVQI